MAKPGRKSITELRAKKLAQIEALKKELVSIENKAGEHFGRLAVRAGLAEVSVNDDVLLKEFQALAARFQGGASKPSRAMSGKAE